MRYIGVDGCRSGWVAVTRGGSNLEYHLVSNIDGLVNEFSDANRILIDVPIGLPWSDAPIRACDRLAREILGKPRKSSVFAVPCREALAAGDVETARRINQRCLSRSIGAQTWGISPKIAEVDRFLRSYLTRCRTIREIHPEVCFWALAGKKPMEHSKKTAEGRAERVRVLERYEPDVGQLLTKVLSETQRKDVQPDDVIDAAVAFVTAEARQGELSCLGDSTTRDLAGLPIEMLYLRTWDRPPNSSSSGRTEARHST